MGFPFVELVVSALGLEDVEELAPIGEPSAWI